MAWLAAPIFIRSFTALRLALTAAALLGSLAAPAAAASRIKDLADFEGMRTNHLIGYGLVVGLDGTGDSLRNSPFTRQSLESVLEQLGVNTRGQNINTRNTAAVLVTAQLPAFAAQGTRIDVTISTLGDSSNLLGGQLLVTPLRGADGEIYAVAQGAVTVGGFSVSGEATSVKSNVTTSGRISNGAIVEREIQYELKTQRSLRISLRNPDFTTARRMGKAINDFLGQRAAVAEDPSNVRLTLPDSYQGDMVALITDIEQLTVTPDLMARVVINEQSGTIVMSDSVRVSTVAIAQGNLTIRVTESPQVSQPGPFSEGQTEIVPRTSIDIDTSADKKLTVLKTEVTLQSLVDGLNALGIGPRDMMEILQSIKQAGALHADLVVQ
ncbi:MAG: flagellar basal body P-ring protein FlgI [Alphaproteobacteria bacterium]